jgi:hypothetical protein
VLPTSKDKDLRIEGDFIGYCSALTTLELNLQPPQLITKAISKMLGKVQALDSVRISHGNTLITAGISNGKLYNVDMTILQLDNLADDDLKLIENDYLARLCIKDVQWNEIGQLAELLDLKHLRIGCEHKTSLAILNSVVPKRMKLGEVPTLESVKIGREEQTITVVLSNGMTKVLRSTQT